MSDFGSVSTHLGYQLHRTEGVLIGRIAKALETLGLSPARASALTFVATHEGCDQMALGRALDINRASTMKVVNDLVDRGLIERRAGRDRRSNALHVTPRGRDVGRQVETITAEADAANFSVLTDEERDVLRAILGKLRAFDPAARDVAPIAA